jgi:(R,R)-butanediol dehydrogenase/meso-butanediol dehydrogenase/diacetyl reductase
LAQFAAVPASACIGVAEYGLTSDAAALGQPMSIAVHSMRRGRLEPGDVAVLIGAGGIGAFLTYAAAELGATVVVSDLDGGRLDIARALGATSTVDPSSGQSIAAVLAENNWVPTVIYEVSGTTAGLADAYAIAERGTRIVLVGLQAEQGLVDYRSLTLREIELIGTNAHAMAADMPEALRLLSSRQGGWGDVAPQALSLDDLVGEGLMPLVERRSTRIKTLIDPGAPTTRATET